MPLSDLPRCQTQIQVEEAIAKPIAYALTPGVGWFGDVVSVAKQHGLKSPGVLSGRWKNEKRNRAIAQSFCHDRGINLEWSYVDHRTGFELLLFRWQHRAYLVPIGSNDPSDWKRNLTQHAVGLRATKANNDAILEAMARVSHSPPVEVVVLGHSLGGAIAQYLASEWQTISRCITFQSAAVPRDIAEQTTGTITVHHYLHPSDVVYPISRDRCGGGLLSGKVMYRGDRVHGLDRVGAHTAILTLLSDTPR